MKGDRVVGVLSRPQVQSANNCPDLRLFASGTFGFAIERALASALAPAASKPFGESGVWERGPRFGEVIAAIFMGYFCLWGSEWHTLFYDLRFAFRQLIKTPGMALLAILTLALGIGANTAIFTVVESVLLRPLPYPNSKQLVFIRSS